MERKTLTGTAGDKVTYCPERGGIITSLILKGKELLFLNEETFEDRTKTVRGGIPLLFPNAGFLENPLFPGLTQHGFARRSSRWTSIQSDDAFSETLEANEETHCVFPYTFRYAVEGGFDGAHSFRLTQTVTNLEPEKPMPLAMGLHPYFHAPRAKKADIVWDFPQGDLIAQEQRTWSEGGTTSIRNPCTDYPGIKLRIRLPDLGTLILSTSSEYERLWIWSLPDQDFVCVEPVMRDVGGLIDNPVLIQPSQTLSTFVRFELE